MKITELEQDFMNGICEDYYMYLDHVKGYARKINDKNVSGVVSSLVKKGLITTHTESDGGWTDQAIIITEKGAPFSMWEIEDIKEEI